MINVQTDDDIKEVIRDCCEVCDQRDIAEDIEIAFVKADEIANELTGSRLKPRPKVLINKSAWMNIELSERILALKTEVCYIIACIVMGRKVKRNGPEWRYFAFESGVIEVETEPRKIESFTLLSEW